MITEIYIENYRLDLTNDIEHGYYSRGRQEELVEQIKAIDPKANPIWGSISRLEKELEELEKQNDHDAYVRKFIYIMKRKWRGMKTLVLIKNFHRNLDLQPTQIFQE